MARYRVDNAYLSEEEYAAHLKKNDEDSDNALVSIFSIIIFVLLTYQSNIYLKTHYTSLFSSEIRVALTLIPGLLTGIIMHIFRGFVARFLERLIGLSVLGVVLYLLWKITFYFLA